MIKTERKLPPTRIKKVAVIHWVDATRDNEWHAMEGVENEWPAVECHTFGVIIAESKERVVIAQTVTSNIEPDVYDGALTIPRRSILKIQPLKYRME